jgi:hypothetical protein
MLKPGDTFIFFQLIASDDSDTVRAIVSSKTNGPTIRLLDTAHHKPIFNDFDFDAK